jgi:hypothetical protein
VSIISFLRFTLSPLLPFLELLPMSV